MTPSSGSGATPGWNATNILAQKYFRGTLGTPGRESSLRQVADRVVDTIAAWGARDGYFADGDEAAAFADELKHLIVTQKAAFNSPVWFNIGVPDTPQQASACFILSVDDEMTSILNWYVEEGVIFKGGSGAGVNLSRIRSSRESLRGGGTASGPVSFMRGADASAGTIKSGGKTRRAAKMVVLDADHPDVEEFVWCKAREEHKLRALEAAGFEVGLDGSDAHSIQYQNANNSVRVTDEFMQAVVDDGDWDLTARTDGAVVDTLRARRLFRQVAEAAWECADPGLQFDTTINHWHTASNTGRITASNPCSEYVHLENSACNLASLNLLAFLGEHDVDTDAIGGFDVDGFQHAVEVVFTAQEILVGNADYPTEPIAETTRASLRVLDQHREAAELLVDDAAPVLVAASREAWFEACALAQRVGVRNSQATVLAPTGTIGLLMDCDTTGIEPDLGLVKTKRLVGGGTMSIVNRTVPRALGRLGYDEEAAAAIVDHIDREHSVAGCDALDPDHADVFATSMGDHAIHHLGHIRMMGAVQPFLSGAISKTCNMPEDVSVDDVEELFMESWRLGRRLPRSRRSLTFEFRVADCKGFVTVGEYEDGRPGEIFVRVSKQGSTLAGIMDAFAISLSHGLQYGVPLRAFVEAFTGMRFEPAGMTDDPDLRIATSIIDYLFRRLAVEYLTPAERAELNILTTGERSQPTLPGVEETATETRQGHDVPPDPPTVPSAGQFAAQLADGGSTGSADAPLCMTCGVSMRRAGSCYVCTDCGATSGCS